MTYVFFHPGQLDDALIDGSFRDQAIHSNLAGLSKTVCTIHGLRIIGGIPVMIVENNGISGGQVDTKTTSTCAEQEYKYIGSEQRC